MKNIEFDKLYNTRDLAENKSSLGIIKSKMLIRGVGLYKGTTNDINKLKNEYNMHTVIDLRISLENQEKLNPQVDGVKYYSMPIFDDAIPGITYENAEAFKKDYDNYNVDMPKMYRAIIAEEKYRNKTANIVKFIMNLPDEDYSVYYHCSAGKDRTGIISMILLLMLGVSKEDIIADYLYTNVDGKAVVDEMVKYAREVEKNDFKADNIAYVYMAREEFINAAFDVIENSYNSIDDFLYNGLNITQEEIDRFRRRMII